MPKHLFFDLDNTLTPSKAPILPEHAPIFGRLCRESDVTVVSGHGEADIRAHLGRQFDGTYYILGQNGNRAVAKSRDVLWNNSLTQSQKDAIAAFIKKARARLDYVVRDENDIIDDRDSQIAFSLIGHHEDRAKKLAFDPEHKIRLKLLADMSDDVEKLRKANVEVRSGGTTVLDFFELGKNKGHNVAKFIKAMDWDKSDCVYVGDALFPGGNDETVIGVIPTHAVKDPRDTFAYVASVLS